MNELSHPKQLSEEQIKAASKILTCAFQDDPLLVYLYPDPLKRKIESDIVWEFSILQGILYGEVNITSSDIEGVAVWLAHPLKDQKTKEQSKAINRRMRKVGREMFSSLGPIFTEKYNNWAQMIVSLQIEHASFPHWELAILGVDPMHQGKGYASMLIRAKLRELDKQNLSCYLHTENEKNVKFYEYFGFKLIGKNKVPNSDFYHHPMLRNNKKKGK